MYINERAEIINACLLMQQIGYFMGTWGNISMRQGDYILLTPSRVNYNMMKPEDIVVIDLEGNKIDGERNATSEKEVHRQIYCARSDIQAVIHAHTPKAMAVSATELEEVPCLVEEMSQLLGGSIPLTSEYVPAEQHFKLGEATAKAIGDKNGVIIRNHGPVACGRNLDEAILTAKVMEKACGIYLSIPGRNCFKPIQAGFVESERYRYLYKYGKEKT